MRTPLVAGVEAHPCPARKARATDRGTLLHLVVPKCSTRSLDVGGAGHDWATGWRVGFRFGEPTDQLGARTDTELAVRPSEVEFDRLRAEEERRADLAVRLPFRDLQRDLELLRRQLVGDTGRAPWKGLAVDLWPRYETRLRQLKLKRGFHGTPVRGVNLMHVRDGKIVEALGYVKAGLQS
jgi:hypothetical protein